MCKNQCKELAYIDIVEFIHHTMFPLIFLYLCNLNLFFFFIDVKMAMEGKKGGGPTRGGRGRGLR